MSLRLTSPRTPNEDRLAAVTDRLVLDAEDVWVFSGSEERIAEIFPILAPWAERIGSALRVRFGNHVGVLRLPGLPALEIVSGKWSEEDFEGMLAELTTIAASLPFSAGETAPLPYERTALEDENVTYTAFVYLRHILSDASPVEARLLPALEAIVREPHRRTVQEPTRVGLHDVTRIEADTLYDLVSGRGAVRVPITSAAARATRGYLPEFVTERRPGSSLDTPENRFVLAFLDEASRILRQVESITTPNAPIHRDRIRADVLWMRERIERYRRHSMWDSVGRMTAAPLGSSVLQRRRGYRDVYRHSVRLRLSSRSLPISAHRARDLLEAKDIATMYELWTFFKVVEVATELLGVPTASRVIHYTHLTANVERGFEVEWPADGVTIAYNAHFHRAAARHSYSLPLRPDIAVFLKGVGIHLLDAKFRVRFVGDDEAERGEFKADDIWKMHGYRDAIRDARSAWVLYPGTESKAFRTGDGTAVDGVGALPLRPGDSGALRNHLSALLESLPLR